MEKVYIENDWYDGPRKGIADFNGIPHRFISNFDDVQDQDDSFCLFPVSAQELALEIEQWNIFVEWNKLYESGKVNTDSHPGQGHINQRWDEIEKILSDKRDQVPDNAMLTYATFKSNGQENRYESSGPSYGVIWCIVESKA